MVVLTSAAVVAAGSASAAVNAASAATNTTIAAGFAATVAATAVAFAAATAALAVTTAAEGGADTLATTVTSVQVAPLSKATRAGLVEAMAQPGGDVSSCSRLSFSNARLLPAA